MEFLKDLAEKHNIDHQMLKEFYVFLDGRELTNSIIVEWYNKQRKMLDYIEENKEDIKRSIKQTLNSKSK